MTLNKQRFGELVDELVHHIATKLKGGRQKYEVTEIELADELGVTQAAIQTWRQGRHMPADREFAGEKLVRIGVQRGMSRQWANALLLNIGYPGRDQLVTEIFSETRPFSRDIQETFLPTEPDNLESPEAPVPLDSLYYIERTSDRHALETIIGQGVTMTIKGPAKMGKSSLLYRVRAAAEANGKRTICLNFREFGTNVLHDADAFFIQFCRRINEELGIDDQIDTIWNPTSTNPANCRRYITRHVLGQTEETIVLCLENVDAIFDASFRSDFFSMLRSWHDDSQYRPIWQRLDRVLVTSTEPYQFIEDIHKSPFNVGEVIELDDFTVEQVSELNVRHDSPLSTSEIQQLMRLLNGHPYLVRRTLYLITKQFISPSALFAQATQDNGPFRAHLTALLSDILDSKEILRTALLEVIKQNTCRDHHIFFRLRGSGLVRREGQAVLPRCQLYAKFFQERLS